jgi:hypothetical protein
MKEAQKKGSHPIGSWIKEGDAHHTQHAVNHLIGEGFAYVGEVPDEDLEHALCRLAMALYCRRHGVIGDFGPDGRDAETSV